MEYVGALIILLGVALFIAYKRQPETSKSPEPVEATYVCDDCGEHECVCHKSED
mgnify:CR=1 FL=1